MRVNTRKNNIINQQEKTKHIRNYINRIILIFKMEKSVIESKYEKINE